MTHLLHIGDEITKLKVTLNILVVGMAWDRDFDVDIEPEMIGSEEGSEVRILEKGEKEV